MTISSFEKKHSQDRQREQDSKEYLTRITELGERIFAHADESKGFKTGREKIHLRHQTHSTEEDVQTTPPVELNGTDVVIKRFPSGRGQTYDTFQLAVLLKGEQQQEELVYATTCGYSSSFEIHDDLPLEGDERVKAEEEVCSIFEHVEQVTNNIPVGM